MSLYIITPPPGPVVTLAEMRLHLKIDSDVAADDDLIEAITAAVTNSIDAEGTLGRALRPQTWAMRFDLFPDDRRVELPMPPLIAIDHVKYYDLGGTQLTLSSSLYDVIGVGAKWGGSFVLKFGEIWPYTEIGRAEAVEVQFQCGYDEASPPEVLVPTPIVQAIKLMVGDLYANRETFIAGMIPNKLPFAAEALLADFTARC